MGEMKIEGLLLTPQKRITTPGGDVFHAMKAGDPGYAGFGEAYFSTILPGSTKPWKRHNQMTLNLVVISGQVRFVVHDDRQDSPSYGLTEAIILGPEAHYARLTIAPKLWMAFQCMENEPGVLINIANMQHDPAEADRKSLQDIFYDWSAV